MVIKFRKFIKIKKIVFDENFYRISKERLVFLGFVLYYISQFYYTTMFNFPIRIIQVIKYSGLLLILTKIFAFDKYTRKKWVLLFVLISLFLISAYFSTYKLLLEYIIIVLGFKDIDYKKIINLYIKVCAIPLIITIICCKIGLIENYIDIRTNGTYRQSWGIGYPTDFAAYFFFLFAAYMFINDSINRNQLIAGIIGVLFLYKLTDARLDCLSIVLVYIGCNALSKIDLNIFDRHIIRFVFKNMFILCAIFMIALTVIYNGKSQAFKKADALLSGRLRFGQRMYYHYGIKIFGQEIEEYGNGGNKNKTEKNQQYRFIDCSYLKIILKYGMITFIITAIASLKLSRYFYNNKMYKFLVIYSIILVNSMIAHHYLEIAYNFMIPLLLSHIYKDENQENIIC